MKILFKKSSALLKEAVASAKIASPENISYGYVYGTIDGTVLSSHNATNVYYGASMNKFMLAFINLALYWSGRGQRAGGYATLTKDELKQYIHYSKGSKGSSEMNRALSGQRRRTDGRHVSRKRAAALATTKQEIDITLRDMGISRKLLPGIRYSGATNKQTPMGVFKFLSYLIKSGADPETDYHEEAKKILNLMKTPFTGHDSRWFREKLAPWLSENGVQINNIYGKGGWNPKAPAGMALGVVLNDDKILVLYSNDSRVENKAWGRKQIHNIILNILSGKPPKVDAMGAPAQKPAPAPATTQEQPQLSSAGLVQIQGNVRDPNKAWGTQTTANCIQQLGSWPIGDISLPEGGKMRGHVSHRKGADFDAALPTKGGYSIVGGAGGVWGTDARGNIFRDISPEELDVASALNFLTTVRNCGAGVFIDIGHINKIKEYARQVLSPADFSKVFRRVGLARQGDTHHRSHFHVRVGGGGKIGRVAIRKRPPSAAGMKPTQQPSTGGRYLPGYEYYRTPDFDFETFYSELDKYFPNICGPKGCGANGILFTRGRDFKFGPEHADALRMLKQVQTGKRLTQAEIDKLQSDARGRKSTGTKSRVWVEPL